MKYLVAITVLFVTSSPAHAMCAATTKNLILVKVHACQKVKIGASNVRKPAHSIHKRGSSIDGILVTGKVIERNYSFEPRSPWIKDGSETKTIMSLQSLKEL